jgi:hypothetical protein
MQRAVAQASSLDWSFSILKLFLKTIVVFTTGIAGCELANAPAERKAAVRMITLRKVFICDAPVFQSLNLKTPCAGALERRLNGVFILGSAKPKNPDQLAGV